MIKENQNIERFYGRRRGRGLGPNHDGIMQNIFPQYALTIEEEQQSINPQTFFNQGFVEFWLEIGFGGGEHLVAQAQNNPQVGLIGAEVFLNGVVSCLRQISDLSPQNLKIYHGDVRPLLRALESQSLDRIYILFPDPWPKARHHKRRLINHENLKEMHRILKGKGEIRFASDDPSYLDWVKITFNESNDYTLSETYHEKPHDWPPTRYQKKALEQGRTCHYFIYKAVH